MDNDGETSLTLFPNFYVQILTDKDFYESLFLVLRCQIHKDLSMHVVKILSKMSSSRTSIMNEGT